MNTEKMIALIIGASKFEDAQISNIPNISTNVKLMKELLTDKQLIGIPEQNIMMSLDETQIEIERKLLDASRKAKNHEYTLLVYYAGHGVISANGYKLFLTAKDTTVSYLDRDGISIENVRDSIRKSRAGRKIVIIDACHSGQMHGTMNNLNSAIQIELNKFEGTYIITSASEDEPALFPHEDTSKPTYFTDYFVKTIREGIDNGQPFITLMELFNEIEAQLRENEKPLPQQSSFQNIGQAPLFVNAKYKFTNSEQHAWNMALVRQNIGSYEQFIEQFPNSEKKKLALEKIKQLQENMHWENATILDVMEAYQDFIQRFPESNKVEQANERMKLLEEENDWIATANEKSIVAILKYMEKYPNGRFTNEATKEIEVIEEQIEWQEAKQKDTLASYMIYRNKYPQGRFIETANEVINKIKANEEDKRQWLKAQELNTLNAYKDYLRMFSNGKNASKAQKIIDYFENDSAGNPTENLYIKHFVNKKDNLSRIARKYKVSVLDLRKANSECLNNISNKDPIRTSIDVEWLKIPIFYSRLANTNTKTINFASSKELSKHFNRQLMLFFTVIVFSVASVVISTWEHNKVPEKQLMEHLNRAQYLIDNQNYKDAIVEYKDALELVNSDEMQEQILLKIDNVKHLSKYMNQHDSVRVK